MLKEWTTPASILTVMCAQEVEEEDGELELCTLEMDKQEDSVINPDLQTKQKQDLQARL